MGESPNNCRHWNRRLIQASAGTPLGEHSCAPDRHFATVCLDCGRFEVGAEKDGVYIEVKFTLNHVSLLEGAAEFLRYCGYYVTIAFKKKEERPPEPTEFVGLDQVINTGHEEPDLNVRCPPLD